MCARGEVGIVSDEYERRIGRFIQAKQQVDHAAAGLRVEIARRLIREQDARIVGERACNRNALLLTT